MGKEKEDIDTATGPAANADIFHEALSELDRETARIVVRTETRRFRKPVTLVGGLQVNEGELQRIAKTLKSKLATGGTAKNGEILVQGDHRDGVKAALIKLGFPESAIEVQ